VRLLLPGYQQALAAAANKSTQIDLGNVPGMGSSRLVAAKMPDTSLPVWLVNCPDLFQRAGGLYQDEHGADWPDKRLGALQEVAGHRKIQTN